MNPYIHGTYDSKTDQRKLLKRRLRAAKKQKQHWNLLDSGRGVHDQGYQFEFENPEEEKSILELVRSHSATSSYMNSVKTAITPKARPSIPFDTVIQRRSSEPILEHEQLEHSHNGHRRASTGAPPSSSTFMLAFRGPMRPEERRKTLPVSDLDGAWHERQQRNGATSNFVLAARGPMHPEEKRLSPRVADITQAWSDRQQRNGATSSFMTAMRGPMHPEERRISTPIAVLTDAWTELHEHNGVERNGATSSYMATVRRESMTVLLPHDPADPRRKSRTSIKRRRSP